MAAIGVFTLRQPSPTTNSSLPRPDTLDRGQRQTSRVALQTGRIDLADSADPAHQIDAVQRLPVSARLALGEGIECHAAYLEGAARGGEAGEVPSMRPLTGPPHRDLVILGEHVLDHEALIGKGGQGLAEARVEARLFRRLRSRTRGRMLA